MPRLLHACLTTLASAAVAATLTACGSPAATPSPNAEIGMPPPGWVQVSSIDGANGRGFQLLLPPSIEVSDNRGAIFANERPPAAGAEIPIQVMADGPDRQAPQDSTSLARWIGNRLMVAQEPGAGVPTITSAQHPAGPAVRYERVDRAGTAQAWHLLAVAFVTPRGVVYLQIDGPEAAWAARRTQAELIVTWFRFH